MTLAADAEQVLQHQSKMWMRPNLQQVMNLSRNGHALLNCQTVLT